MADYSKPDHWSVKAQKEGYPARSVYKFSEMDEKFGLLKPVNVRSGRTFRALDLGASPGSWSLYILRKFFGRPGSSGAEIGGISSSGFTLVSVDLSPLSRQHDQGLFDKPGFNFIQGDFTSAEIRETILSYSPYNLIISDAAPATTGIRQVDTLRSLDLAETALMYAETSLIPGGNMITKVFQGGETGTLLKNMRSVFGSAKSFKPRACRPDSFEIYFLGLGKK